MTDTTSPKVFISYSWDDATHKSWVKELAARLRKEGIDAKLDQWEVTLGSQTPQYMEQSVRDNDFVLIVCTPQYKSRSDNRTGGVGYEGDIMTAEVFVHRNHEKFIPLLRNGEWKDAAPSWLAGKAFLDFRGDTYSEDEYQELYRNLFDEREKAPPLGEPKGLAPRPNSLVLRGAKDDKDFTLWLSLQLINEGYQVWCDLLNSEPGEYTQEMREKSIGEKAIKYLYVFSNFSNTDAELLKELRFAFRTMQSKKLMSFVVPMQIDDFPKNEWNLLLQDTSSIDFSPGWSRGLHQLLEYLEKSGVPRNEEFKPSKTNDLWRLQFSAAKGLKDESEELFSNWFPIQLPDIIYFHELHRNGVGLPVTTKNLPFPALQHNDYLITFAWAEDFRSRLGVNISIKATTEVRLQDFLDGNYDQKLANKDTSWNIVLELLNNAWDKFLSQSRLKNYVLANKRICYYFPVGFSEKGDNKAYFQGVDGKRSWRSLAGKHKSQFWHFGIQASARLHPKPVFLVKPHALASSDGIQIWQSKERLHTARRRWFKNWWNTEWRDRLLAAMSFFSTNGDFFEIPLGTDVSISVSSSPLIFKSPVSYINSKDTIMNTEIVDENENQSEGEGIGEIEGFEEFDDEMLEDDDL
jgi:hypothetical protein